MINRVYYQHVGPWRPDLDGVDTLTRADLGALLVDYLGVDEARLASAVEKLVAAGRFELAGTALEWARTKFPKSARLSEARRLVYEKLTEKYQALSVFKLTLYEALAGEAVLPVEIRSAGMR